MTVEEAAKQLGMNPHTLRLALRQNRFLFGTAIKTTPNRWAYYINDFRLKLYLEGKDYGSISNNVDNYSDDGSEMHSY